MAFEPHTAEMFNPLPPHPVLFTVTMVAHCIREWETGDFQLKRFDGLMTLGESSAGDGRIRGPY